MSQRKVLGSSSKGGGWGRSQESDGSDVVHLKKTSIEPKYFALVRNARTQFVKNRHGQVIVFSDRDNANEACRRKGWPGNIGMGEQKFVKFKEQYMYILDPSYASIPRASPWRVFVYPIFALFTLTAVIFGVMRYTNLFEAIAAGIGMLSGDSS
eukprot:TRINITY_DN24571_c0_g1_i1.p1 TRINITY_DN24571_c0_g1~~TRINITY_DN24571_c0_g1_i1.p1  ORF type:complete len:154 (+),score=25.48 TRINITY_DN24571_c0_g1_i1:733-1194(+)